MALKEQSSGRHNRMLGQRVNHPKSTNYDEDFPKPPAKRIKRDESADRASQSGTDSEQGLERYDSPHAKGAVREIPDSEGDDEYDNDGEQFPGSQTELESALPAIKTDKEAITAYEAARAAADGDTLDLQGRIGKRRWVQGKSSIYVDAFNLALETVLEEEHHLFDEAEIGVFERWRALSYEAQFLCVLRSSVV